MCIHVKWAVFFSTYPSAFGKELPFDDQTAFALPTEYLRVESPSAEVQGHHAGQKKIIAGRRHVGVIAIEPVGRYAVRLVFDDLHDSGIFSSDYRQ